MARIRTVKPEFWGDEKLSPLDPIHRLVFLGLIGMADDGGRVVDNVKVVDAFVFPNSNDTSGPSLDILANTSRIIRGVTGSGQRAIQIANWGRHQRVDHPNLKACLPELVGVQEDRSSLARPSRAARDSTYDLRPTTGDRRPANVGDNQLPAEVLRTGEPYFRDPKTRLARIGEVEMILGGVRGYRVTPEMVARGLSDMHQAGVEWRPAVLRKWFERAGKLNAEDQAVRDVAAFLTPLPAVILPGDPMDEPL